MRGPRPRARDPARAAQDDLRRAKSAQEPHLGQLGAKFATRAAKKRPKGYQKAKLCSKLAGNRLFVESPLFWPTRQTLEALPALSAERERGAHPRSFTRTSALLVGCSRSSCRSCDAALLVLALSLLLFLLLSRLLLFLTCLQLSPFTRFPFHVSQVFYAWVAPDVMSPKSPAKMSSELPATQVR